ncbi:4301_t:CDS:2, partial [Gigaspora rosea]
VNIEDYFDKVYYGHVDMDEVNTSNANSLFHSQTKTWTNLKKHEISTSNTMDDNETNIYKATIDTKVNVEDYFDKVYHSSIDMDAFNTNFKAITISEGDQFSDFEEAE